MHFTDQDGGFEELHLFSRGDGSFNFSATDQRTDIDRALDDRLFSDHEDVFGVNLPFEMTFNLERSFETEHASDTDVFSKQCDVFRVPSVVFPLRILLPHTCSLLTYAHRPYCPPVHPGSTPTPVSGATL